MSYFKKQRSLGADGSSSGETPGIVSTVYDWINNLAPGTLVLPPPQPAYGTQPAGTTVPVTPAPAASSSLITPRNLLIGGAVLAGGYFLLKRKK